MLFGEYHGQIDDKGRIRIPARLKSDLNGEVTITKGINGCLFLFSANDWNEKIGSKLDSVPLSDISVQRSLRAFFAGANVLEEDNQGRTLLPKNLREFGAIKKDIVFIGVGNRAELWSKEVYDDYLAGKVTNIGVDYDKLFGELNKYGV
ncbi:MAG: division/cell wall cluster transcriptional repressor MraZ [Firmicutes bacterium]|nr:division/cell wall cluster transcriptional repressor MraZ [Bacillota bacterium]